MKAASACFALLVLAGPAFAESHVGKLTNIACKTGPVTRTFGGQSWLVYSCADRHSILVVSNHGDPPTSEYIMLSPVRDHVEVVGEGWATGTGGNTAFAEMKDMSARQLGVLVAETRGLGH